MFKEQCYGGCYFFPLLCRFKKCACLTCTMRKKLQQSQEEKPPRKEKADMQICQTPREVLHQLQIDTRACNRPSSLTTFSQPKRIFLVGLVLGQVLEVQRAALDELVQGLLRTHQLLQLLSQLLLLPRPGGVFKCSPASGNRAAPQRQSQCTTRDPNLSTAAQSCRCADGVNPQHEAILMVYKGAPGLCRSAVLSSSQGAARK